jgi:peptide/nickel transport system ATP-binding protein
MADVSVVARPVVMTRGALLDVDGLNVEFRTGRGWLRVVDDVSFAVGQSQTIGLVGESGSGKTVSALAVMGLAPALGARVEARSINFEGQELTQLRGSAMNRLRGDRIGMIFQQPGRSLNPAYTVGEQIAETVRRFRKVSRKQAWRRAVEMLDRVHIARAEARAKEYPHTFSGGMCQRVMIAMALACEPSLLIADEPTTALDVTVQARILNLLRELQRDTGVAMLFISHDLGVIAEMCEAVVVMYAGQVVEQAPVDPLFYAPQHPYTDGLLGSIPRVGHATRLSTIPGTVPNMSALPPGCRFHPRCPHAVAARCDRDAPALEPVGPAQSARCVRVHELDLPGLAGRA